MFRDVFIGDTNDVLDGDILGNSIRDTTDATLHYDRRLQLTEVAKVRTDRVVMVHKKRSQTSSKPLLTEWQATPKGNLARYVVDRESAGNVAIVTPEGWAVRKNPDAPETVMRDLYKREIHLTCVVVDEWLRDNAERLDFEPPTRPTTREISRERKRLSTKRRETENELAVLRAETASAVNAYAAEQLNLKSVKDNVYRELEAEKRKFEALKAQLHQLEAETISVAEALKKEHLEIQRLTQTLQVATEEHRKLTAARALDVDWT